MRRIEDIVEIMVRKPYLLDMGAGKLSGMFKVSREMIYDARNIARNRRYVKNTDIPRILLFDIETAPMMAFVWKLWKENVGLPQIVSDWFILCWSAKWLYSPDIITERLSSEEALAQNDGRIVKDLWELVNKADIVIAYNGVAFDIPKINSRFLVHGLPPTKPYFSVDPCLVAKKQFGFSSNKLDALAQHFGIPLKLDTDFDLWRKCYNGDEKSLEYMATYNKRDVEILEEVYLRMRPWIKGHPNIGNILSSDKPSCSICGSSNLIKLEGEYYYTSVGKYELFKCVDCGAISRGRKNLNVGVNKIVPVGK